MVSPSQSISLKNLYEKDFYLWLLTMAKLLKEQRFNEVDLENLIEEIEAMGRSEKREIESRLITILEHLLKLIYWQAEKENNARGWRNTIVEQREQLNLVLKDSPSLKVRLDEIFGVCYQKAIKIIIRKYELPATMFPSEPCFSLEDVLNADYFPE
ncbi:DUF29 domain-containing protein [Gloeothece verrucosa]|uniref:DUF29 domain-containing protein n=1 Tax=Gloeothece verrucosa (strain PCC 7822) TaxID=497965 RepID=E0UBK2_GLOV7|nr:DUF29 domain-containing protein [Gloeothece verrucosa]ADN13946.1 protein of unknown function DUF29 [Gloeothece verrucosa PCC 7822]